MKKLLFLLFALFAFYACEKDYDGVVEATAELNDAEIIEVSVPDTAEITENGGSFEISATVEYLNELPEVMADLIKAGVRQSRIRLYAGTPVENPVIYSGVFEFSDTPTAGAYTVNFYVNGKLAASSAVVIAGVNHPPTVSNLVMPDTVTINESFVFSVEASDPDGASDIAGAYYNVFDPDGNLVSNSNGVSDFPLSDNGDTASSGDEVANDQIYTMKLSFPGGSRTGTWRFEFFAIDRQRAKSNIITHNLTVTQ